MFHRPYSHAFCALALPALLALAAPAQTQVPLGQPVLLNTGAFTNVAAAAISNNSQIVGNSTQGPVYWASPDAVPVALAGGAQYHASGINSSGVIVGTGPQGATFWPSPTSSPSLLLIGNENQVLAVNDAGVILGAGIDSLVEWHSASGVPNTIADEEANCLGVTGQFTTAGIDNNGDVVTICPSTTIPPFNLVPPSTIFFASGSNSSHVLPGAFPSAEVGINDFLNVVGGGYWSSPTSPAVFPANGLAPVAINNRGQILATNAVWTFVVFGTPRTVTADSNGSVQLVGSGVTPDGNPATSFSWSEGTAALGTGPSISVQLNPGPHTITLTIGDGQTTLSAEEVITVQPNPLSAIESQITQMQSTLSSDFGALQANQDTITNAVSGITTGFQQVNQQLVSVLANTTTANRVLADLQSQQAAFNASLVAIQAEMQGQQAALNASLAAQQANLASAQNLAIEHALADRDDAPLSLMLPAKSGGQLEAVQSLVQSLAATLAPVGSPDNAKVTKLVADGNAAFQAGLFHQAFDDFAEVYHLLADHDDVGRSHR